MSSLLMMCNFIIIAPEEKISSQILYNIPHTYLHHGHTMVVALQSNRCHVTMITMIKKYKEIE